MFYGTKAYNLSLELGAVFAQNYSASLLQNTNKKLGRFEDALKYAEIYMANKDSLFNHDKTKALAEAEKKYEAEKKQLQIDKLNKERELQDKTIARKQNANYFIFSRFYFFTSFLYFPLQAFPSQ